MREEKVSKNNEAAGWTINQCAETIKFIKVRAAESVDISLLIYHMSNPFHIFSQTHGIKMLKTSQF